MRPATLLLALCAARLLNLGACNIAWHEARSPSRRVVAAAGPGHQFLCPARAGSPAAAAPGDSSWCCRSICPELQRRWCAMSTALPSRPNCSSCSVVWILRPGGNERSSGALWRRLVVIEAGAGIMCTLDCAGRLRRRGDRLHIEGRRPHLARRDPRAVCGEGLRPIWMRPRRCSTSSSRTRASRASLKRAGSFALGG